MGLGLLLWARRPALYLLVVAVLVLVVVSTVLQADQPVFGWCSPPPNSFWPWCYSRAGDASRARPRLPLRTTPAPHRPPDRRGEGNQAESTPMAARWPVRWWGPLDEGLSASAARRSAMSGPG